MNITLKLPLVAIVPLVLALSAVLIATQVQYQSLSEKTQQLVKPTLSQHIMLNGKAS